LVPLVPLVPLGIDVIFRYAVSQSLPSLFTILFARVPWIANKELV
jgi:hypothetical protein